MSQNGSDKARVFVSYPAECFKEVEKLVPALKAEGLDIIWDVGLDLPPPKTPPPRRLWASLIAREERAAWQRANRKVQGGDDIKERLGAAIDDADYVVVYWSRSARASSWCSWEVLRANASKKPLVLVRASGDETPVDPFTINAVECRLDKLHEAIRLLQRGEIQPPDGVWDPEVNQGDARGSLSELFFNPLKWWRATGNVDGNLPLLAPNHLTRGRPADGWKTRTSVQAVVVMIMLAVLAILLGVDQYVVAKTLATVTVVAAGLATTVGFGAAVAGCVYGCIIGLLTALVWELALHSTDMSGRTGLISFATLVSSTYAVAWWRFQLGSHSRGPLQARRLDLLTGLGWGLLATLLLVTCLLLFNPPTWLRPWISPLKDASLVSQVWRYTFALGLLFYLFAAGIRATMLLINRARDGARGIGRPALVVLGAFLLFGIVRAVCGPALDRTICKFLPEGALIGAIVVGAYLLPYARQGAQTPADKTTLLGLGSTLGLVPGVFIAFFLVPRFVNQAWYVLTWGIVVLAVAWGPLLLIQGRSGFRPLRFH